MLLRAVENGGLLGRSCTKMTRAASAVGAGKQGFAKKKKVTSKDKSELQHNRSRLAKEYEAIGKMVRATIVKPVRSAEELAEARKMNLMYFTERTRMNNRWQKGEQQRIRLRDIALAEVPTSLREAASKPDDSPFPYDFIWALQNPPLESQEIFGPNMAGEQFRMDG